VAILLFRLRYVPEDEADEVRALLEEHDISFYETSAGNWRISLPAIWLPDDSQLIEARQLLEAYQHQRYRKARQELEESKSTGTQRTLWRNFIEDPFRVSLYLGLILLVLYLSLQVFLAFS